jgi:hypothetical protein
MPSITPLNGSIVGRLWLYSTEPTASGDERITADNGDSLYVTHCDQAGGWGFHNVPAGTYRLTFEHDSFTSAQIVGLQFVGNGTAVIPAFSLQSLATPDTLDSVGTRVDRNGNFGYAFFSHGLSNLSLAFDHDSSVLANWASDAEFVDGNHSAVLNEFNIPMLWNWQIRKYAGSIAKGDYVYVAIGEGDDVAWLRPSVPLPSGRFSWMPFSRPVEIVRLQYNGAQ